MSTTTPETCVLEMGMADLVAPSWDRQHVENLDLPALHTPLNEETPKPELQRPPKAVCERAQRNTFARAGLDHVQENQRARKYMKSALRASAEVGREKRKLCLPNDCGDVNSPGHAQRV